MGRVVRDAQNFARYEVQVVGAARGHQHCGRRSPARGRNKISSSRTGGRSGETGFYAGRAFPLPPPQYIRPPAGFFTRNSSTCILPPQKSRRTSPPHPPHLVPKRHQSVEWVDRHKRACNLWRGGEQHFQGWNWGRTGIESTAKPLRRVTSCATSHKYGSREQSLISKGENAVLDGIWNRIKQREEREKRERERSKRWRATIPCGKGVMILWFTRIGDSWVDERSPTVLRADVG